MKQRVFSFASLLTAFRRHGLRADQRHAGVMRPPEAGAGGASTLVERQ
jgi:hypothetical protein